MEIKVPIRQKLQKLKIPKRISSIYNKDPLSVGITSSAASFVLGMGYSLSMVFPRSVPAIITSTLLLDLALISFYKKLIVDKPKI